MKLSTLLEVQRCFDLLRDAEQSRKSLSGEQYVECLRVKSVLDYEIEQITKNQQVEVDGAAA